jgi:hypothetical protein
MSEAPPPREDIHPVFQLSSATPNRLIHLVPEELAVAVPEHPLFSYPKATQPQDGFIDVSCKDFANAINRAAWYLFELLGPAKSFDTVCYMGPSKCNARGRHV